MRVLADRYELGEVIGAGGMATVHEAVDRQLGRRVAVKLLDAHGAEASVRERFVREARSTATVHHPNVVTVFDAGEDDSTLYLVMERVDGRSLSDLLRERGPLDPGEARSIIDQMLAGLAAAHERGLVHRDVKPANVLVADNGTIKLADFGIAKHVDELASSLTHTGQVIGTTRYLAPEQAAGSATTPRSDVYAAGIVLYELLAGRPPFSFETPVATMLAHQRDPVPPLAEQRPGLDPALVAVVDRALAKDPAGRFADAAAMRAALRAPADATAVLPAAAGATATSAAATTAAATTAAAAPTTASRRNRRGAVLLAVGAAALVVALLAAIAASGGGREPEPALTGETTTTAAAETTTTTTEPPLSLGSLANSVAAGPPSTFGEKGKDLLDRLQKVQQASADKQGEEARKGIEEIEKWVREGDLDPAIGQAAVAVLEPIAATEPPRGRGGGEDDD